MDDARLAERQRASQLLGYRDIARGAPDSRAVDLEGGVFASIVPATPDASIPNSVLYAASGALLARWEALSALYRDAGVRAWTVWVRPGDDVLVSALEDRGHVLDGSPALMAAGMDELDIEPRVALDLDREPSWADVAEINDAAYGLAPGTLGAGIAAMPAGEVRLQPLIARLHGVPAAGLAWLASDDGDCTVQVVATLPRARGRGLAGELMREALRRAAAAGCTSASLEASGKGEPLYRRLGYRVLGRLRMLEHRG